MPYTHGKFKANITQHKAITHPPAPIMILAGAGTGKTTTLIHRIIYLIQNYKTDPKSILAITYTEKAARDLKDRIIDVKFKTYGCGSAIASSTMFVEMLKGKTIEEAKLIKDKDIAMALELPPIKLHCSVLAESGIKKAIENWEQKKAHRLHNGGPL